MKGNNTFAKFFSSIFNETWKTVVALCGAIFLDFGKLEKRIKKKCKNARKQYICQIFSSIFKETWKTVVALCGAIFLDFGKLEKRIKKMQKCKEAIHLPIFFRQFSRKPGKR